METEQFTHNVALNEEEAIDYEFHKEVLYWTYGLGTTWMIVLGYLIYYWYPYQITNNSWWATQCPVTAYTEKVDGAAGV
jgi:cytochrome b subunit of formate dehydrogenase